jgi:cell division protein FtsB
VFPPARTLRAMPPAVSTHDSRRSAQVTYRVVALLSTVLMIVFLISFVFSDRGISELQYSRKRVESLRADIQRLEAENVRLHSEIESVKQSTYTVERIAREDLGMSKKGEVVYMLPKAK